MSLLKIAWRSISERRLASFLTALSMALGVALVIAVLVIHSVVENYFRQTATGYNIIVGAKGGKLQLVLNTVYHLSQPIENIPWSYYKEFRPGGHFADQVEWAVPYCLGDNYQGFRVVGTSPELFERLEYSPGETYRFREGKNFQADDYFAAVVGDQVARRTGLKVGDEFNPTHGMTEQGHTHDPFKVVGILAPTGTSNDRALFVNMEGFYLIPDHAKPVAPEDEHHDEAHHDESHPAAEGEHEHDAGEHAHDDHDEADHEPGEGEHAHDDHEHTDHDHGHDGHDHDHEGHDHDHHHHEPLPENQREVTAVLVKTAFPFGIDLPRVVNEGNVAQAVSPTQEIAALFEGIVSNLQKILLLLAWLIVIVAGVGVMVSIYNTMNERRREIAIMRALGASRGTVLRVVLLESVLLSLLGGLLGLALGHGLIAVISPIVLEQTGVSIGALQLGWSTYQVGDWKVDIIWELALVPLLVVLASLAGFVPAMAAYRTDVARALTASP